MTGQKFYFLKNEAVLLELGLIQFAMHSSGEGLHASVITPDLARVEVLEGIGFMPRDPNPKLARSTRSPTPIFASSRRPRSRSAE